MKIEYLEVADAIISASAFSKEELNSKSRNRELVLVRQVVFYFLLENHLCTQRAAGELFGRDHATALYGQHTIANMLYTKDKKTILIISTLIKAADEYIKTRNCCLQSLQGPRNREQALPRHAYRNKLGNYCVLTMPRFQGYGANYGYIVKTVRSCNPK